MPTLEAACARCQFWELATDPPNIGTCRYWSRKQGGDPERDPLTRGTDFCKYFAPQTIKFGNARYPGDAVHITHMRRGGELGDIRIMYYGPTAWRVASFLPGRSVWLEGDTPKTEPETDTWCETGSDASVAFAGQIGQALTDGWRPKP